MATERRLSRPGLAGLCLLGALAVTGCAGDPPPRGPDVSITPGVTVEVAETEYEVVLDPRDGLIPANYRFVVRNDGRSAHALVVRGPGVDERTRRLDAGGGPAELVARLRPGTYELWCPIGDHRGRGMQTTLIVEPL